MKESNFTSESYIRSEIGSGEHPFSRNQRGSEQNVYKFGSAYGVREDIRSNLLPVRLTHL